MTTAGFELVREETIEEINTVARLYRHVATGAQLLSLENDDENKVFGITFRTPPPDSTGIAHIMEHSVLGGSHKYPLKEPFVQLIKGSLKTFLNAMTYPGPDGLSGREHRSPGLLQPGGCLSRRRVPSADHAGIIWTKRAGITSWTTVDAPLKYKGVVFNEMKGAYSSPDMLLYRYSQQSLFPGQCLWVGFGRRPGGDSAVDL